MKKLFFFLSLALLSTNLRAQQDMEGCKDHPLLTRLPDFYIESCLSNYNSAEVPTGNNQFTPHEGTVTRIKYVTNQDDEAKMKSILQVIRNYENAIIGKGGKKVFSNNEFGTFRMMQDGKETLISAWSFYLPQGGGVGSFELLIVEKEAMKQEVEANALFKELNEKGSVALYINFDTGKSTIKSESQSIIDEIVKMMKSNPGLKVSIEGHTDNVGSASSNQKLSEERAAAVVKALTAKGIDKSRLASKGWGQTKPVADNSSSDGKAKNRRVEIVKL